MNKTVVISVFILTVGIVLSVYLFNQANRYAVINAGDGKVYKTDRATGETLLIYGMEEFQIQNDNENEIVTTEEKVLSLTKNAKTLNSGLYGLRNDSEIRSRIRDLQGDIRVDGWKAEKFDDQVYLVSFIYHHNGNRRGYFFEVNTEVDMVRNVVGDSELLKKYDLSN